MTLPWQPWTRIQLPWSRSISTQWNSSMDLILSKDLLMSSSCPNLRMSSVSVKRVRKSFVKFLLIFVFVWTSSYDPSFCFVLLLYFVNLYAWSDSIWNEKIIYKVYKSIYSCICIFVYIIVYSYILIFVYLYICIFVLSYTFHSWSCLGMYSEKVF